MSLISNREKKEINKILTDNKIPSNIVNMAMCASTKEDLHEIICCPEVPCDVIAYVNHISYGYYFSDDDNDD